MQFADRYMVNERKSIYNNEVHEIKQTYNPVVRNALSKLLCSEKIYCDLNYDESIYLFIVIYF